MFGQVTRVCSLTYDTYNKSIVVFMALRKAVFVRNENELGGEDFFN
jgi:hypothetical protein